MRILAPIHISGNITPAYLPNSSFSKLGRCKVIDHVQRSSL
jgi:hypothetical protein